MRRFILLTALCTAVTPAHAQVPQLLRPGQRVWVRWRTSTGALTDVRGQLAAINGDTLRVNAAATDLLVPVGPATEVFVSSGGRRSSVGQAAAIGFFVGILTGAIVGYVSGEDCPTGEWLCFDRETTAAAGAVALGGLGLIGGLVVGASSPRESWVPVAMAVAARPINAPLQRAVQLRFSASF